MSDLVVNPEDRFSCDEAHSTQVLTVYNAQIQVIKRTKLPLMQTDGMVIMTY